MTRLVLFLLAACFSLAAWEGAQAQWYTPPDAQPPSLEDTVPMSELEHLTKTLTIQSVPLVTETAVIEGTGSYTVPVAACVTQDDGSVLCCDGEGLCTSSISSDPQSPLATDPPCGMDVTHYTHYVDVPMFPEREFKYLTDVGISNDRGLTCFYSYLLTSSMIEALLLSHSDLHAACESAGQNTQCKGTLQPNETRQITFVTTAERTERYLLLGLNRYREEYLDSDFSVRITHVTYWPYVWSIPIIFSWNTNPR